MDEIPPWMKQHIGADHDFQQKIESALFDESGNLRLATKADIEQLTHWRNNLIIAGKILEGGSKWSYRAIIILATIIGAIAVITGAWKGLLAWFIVSK